jgi:hypothetical protein
LTEDMSKMLLFRVLEPLVCDQHLDRPKLGTRLSGPELRSGPKTAAFISAGHRGQPTYPTGPHVNHRQIKDLVGLLSQAQ